MHHLRRRIRNYVSDDDWKFAALLNDLVGSNLPEEPALKQLTDEANMDIMLRILISTLRTHHPHIILLYSSCLGISLH